MKNKLRKMI